jgi:transcriptional regulator of acetoin/glycerol metabolism
MFRRALAGRLESAVVHSDGGLRFEARFQAARAGSVLARLREGVQRIHALASSAVPAGSSVTADPGDGVLDPVAGHVLHVARRAFERDIPVLINGETGTGKEVLARRLHADSSRAGGPFVAINCSSLPAGLIESEFFGYEDGVHRCPAWWCAGQVRDGAWGTLFLDEIGDMPLDLQGRLLRVLQERCFTRLAGARLISSMPASWPRPIDVWIPWWRRGVFAKICTTGSRVWACVCRPCGSAGIGRP